MCVVFGLMCVWERGVGVDGVVFLVNFCRRKVWFTGLWLGDGGILFFLGFLVVVRIIVLWIRDRRG